MTNKIKTAYMIADDKDRKYYPSEFFAYLSNLIAGGDWRDWACIENNEDSIVSGRISLSNYTIAFKSRNDVGNFDVKLSSHRNLKDTEAALKRICVDLDYDKDDIYWSWFLLKDRMNVQMEYGGEFFLYKHDSSTIKENLSLFSPKSKDPYREKLSRYIMNEVQFDADVDARDLFLEDLEVNLRFLKKEEIEKLIMQVNEIHNEGLSKQKQLLAILEKAAESSKDADFLAKAAVELAASSIGNPVTAVKFAKKAIKLGAEPDSIALMNLFSNGSLDIMHSYDLAAAMVEGGLEHSLDDVMGCYVSYWAQKLAEDVSNPPMYSQIQYELDLMKKRFPASGKGQPHSPQEVLDGLIHAGLKEDDYYTYDFGGYQIWNEDGTTSVDILKNPAQVYWDNVKMGTCRGDIDYDKLLDYIVNIDRLCDKASEETARIAAETDDLADLIDTDYLALHIKRDVASGMSIAKSRKIIAPIISRYVKEIGVREVDVDRYVSGCLSSARKMVETASD